MFGISLCLERPTRHSLTLSHPLLQPRRVGSMPSLVLQVTVERQQRRWKRSSSTMTVVRAPALLYQKQNLSFARARRCCRLNPLKRNISISRDQYCSRLERGVQSIQSLITMKRMMRSTSLAQTHTRRSVRDTRKVGKTRTRRLCRVQSSMDTRSRAQSQSRAEYFILTQVLHLGVSCCLLLCIRLQEHDIAHYHEKANSLLVRSLCILNTRMSSPPASRASLAN
mmetsp:Transcript_31274/g.68668  ORF Transcript_31274/g.68668 Transcript_31274/m.68668 type:complete len:225 (+) Transcript_31274:3848-4522(+)